MGHRCPHIFTLRPFARLVSVNNGKEILVNRDVILGLRAGINLTQHIDWLTTPREHEWNMWVICQSDKVSGGHDREVLLRNENRMNLEKTLQ